MLEVEEGDRNLFENWLRLRESEVDRVGVPFGNIRGWTKDVTLDGLLLVGCFSSPVAPPAMETDGSSSIMEEVSFSSKSESGFKRSVVKSSFSEGVSDSSGVSTASVLFSKPKSSSSILANEDFLIHPR